MFDSVSLDALAKLYDLSRKGDYLLKSIGRRREEFSPDDMREFAAYCVNDAEITAALYRCLEAGPEARDLLSMTIKMYTSPALILDVPALTEYQAEVLSKQEAAQSALQGLFRFDDRDEFLRALRSPGKFSAMLESLGREAPTKTTPASLAKLAKAIEEGAALAERTRGRAPTKQEAARGRAIISVIDQGGRIPALAKEDQEFRDLLEDEDENVALLAQMRAENNSSIALTRADTFLGMAGRSPFLPIPLAAWGAHTGRYAAGTGSRDSESDRINLQNLPKRGGDLGLRRAIKAPPGHKLVSGDSAQIEARVGAWLAGQDDLVSLFRTGGDPYAEMAAAVYGGSAWAITQGIKKGDKEMKRRRDVGKTTVLSSQYGIGAAKFARYLSKAGLRLAETQAAHEAKAAEINKLYNFKHSAIAGFRKECDQVAHLMLDPQFRLDNWTRARFRVSGDAPIGGGVRRAPAAILPNGFQLIYPGLRAKDGELFYDFSSGAVTQERKLYGGALFNNLTQGLAFAVLAWQGVRLSELHPDVQVVLNIHDEWILSVPDPLVGEMRERIGEVMSTSPPWLPSGDEGIPLKAETRVADTLAG
jgi:DNA polymerase